MYICVCNRVTDRQIHETVAAGATTLRQVRKQLPIGTQCGRCMECASQLVKERAQLCAADACVSIAALASA